MKKTILVDLDGTLADCKWRIKDGKCNHAKLLQDKPNRWCKQIINKFKDSHEIVLFTARNECYRSATEKWLELNNIIYNDLQMCPVEFTALPNYLSKYEMLKKSMLDLDEIEFIIDDNEPVVNMFRSLGLVVLQCDKTNY